MTVHADRLARTFAELADSLVEDFDVVDLLSHLGERCVELFDAAAAGLLVTDDQGVLQMMAATSEAMELIEVFQLQNSEGPCFDCYRTGEAVQVEDLAGAADRWPRLVPIATGAGFRSAHAFPLRLRGRAIGALNLFRVTSGRLEPSEVVAAQALADVATIAILQHRDAVDAQALADELHLALNSRIAIDQAKGVVAQRAGVDMDEAFAHLRVYARGHGRPLGEVAEEVIDGRIDVAELVAADEA
jgi:transcriptional regulator with GAF, ATPase, and Fis domain